MSRIEQSGAIPTLGIFNLKKAQQSQKQGIVFKSHQKRWAKISPENKKATYGANDEMKFKMKGQGVDYINFESSFLLVKIWATTYHHGADLGQCFINGAHDLIYRQQTRSGAFNLEDVIEVNRFLTMEFMGSVHTNDAGHYKDYFAKIDIGVEDQLLPHTAETAVWVKVPFRTILDAGDYIPVYQLAESLDLIFTLNTNGKTLLHKNFDGGLANTFTSVYQITDAYILADGLVATNNSILDNTPYKFPSVAVINFVDQLPPMNAYEATAGAGLQRTFTHDVKKTSLKKYLAGFFCDSYDTVQALAQNPKKYPQSLNASTIEFSMGGILYPYINGLDNKQLMWTEVERYFHLLENTISTVASKWLNYEHHWFDASHIVGGSYSEHFNTIYAAVFDRLNQRNDVVSGIDTERYDVNITFKGLRGVLKNGVHLPIIYLVSFYLYNIMITIIGGEIKVED